jgi:hypothetical protein
LALVNNVDGLDNTAVGSGALLSNVAGNDNTAVGVNALNANISSDNVAVGLNAAAANTIGVVNTAVGSLALETNTTGTENTAVGRRALEFVDGGHENTAVGWGAGSNYTRTETNNICIGDQTLGVVGESDAIRIGDNSTSLGIDVLNNGAALNLISIGPGLSLGGINVLVTLLGSAVQVGALLPTVAGAANCLSAASFRPPRLVVRTSLWWT